MKLSLALSALLIPLPLAAELPASLPQDAGLPAPTPAVAPEATTPILPVEPEPQTPADEAQEPGLSEAEQRIRVGIIMLARLHDLLSGIKDEATAEAAVPPVMRASAEFLSWAQGFSSLPPLDAETQRSYENRYLSIIDELNTRIRIQGEHIASAEFYGSRDLPAALVRLVTSMQ